MSVIILVPKSCMFEMTKILFSFICFLVKLCTASTVSGVENFQFKRHRRPDTFDVKLKKTFLIQSRHQTAVHLVASRQTGTATAILRALLQSAGKDIRLKVDGVSSSKN